jgi:hypothetical protein
MEMAMGRGKARGSPSTEHLLLCVWAAVAFVTPCSGQQWNAGSSNSCVFANNGECDDGRPGSHTAVCDRGTDTNDCARIRQTPALPQGTNTCVAANNGECDDGRPGSFSSVCEWGTDTNDCEYRHYGGVYGSINELSRKFPVGSVVAAVFSGSLFVVVVYAAVRRFRRAKQQQLEHQTLATEETEESSATQGDEGSASEDEERTTLTAAV